MKSRPDARLQPWRLAGVLLCLWALLGGQGMALWHQQAHGGTGLPQLQTQALNHAHGDAHGAADFGHEIGSQCSLLDHLLGLAAAPAAPTLAALRPAPGRAAPPQAAQCLPQAAQAFEARAPPRG